MLADAISFLVSALFLGRIQTVEAAHLWSRQTLAGNRSSSEGLRYVFTHRYLPSMVASVAIFNFFGNVGGAIVLVYFVRELGLGALTIGLASVSATSAP